jgi:glycosyltransferase involved in cell wall biosynthesis
VTSLGTIAIISDSAGFGGAELYLANLVSYLSNEWRFVALLSDRADEETRRRLGDAGAELIVIPGLRRIPGAPGIARAVSALRALNPTLVHVNLSDQGDGLGPLIAARLARRHTVVTLNLVIPKRARWREHVSSWALRQPDTAICVSESVATYAHLKGARTSLIVYGLDEPQLAPEPRVALGLSSDSFIVGGIGRLHDQKGWDVLCRAAALVREALPEVEFSVIGDGPEWESLTRSSSCDGVRFLGYREQASSFLRAFDVFVVPSRYEAFGFVALEAMYAGVPVIASDIGGLPEVVADCGTLVPPDRPDLLASAIIDLARDPIVRSMNLEKAAKRARSLFTLERMARETAQVYRSVAK